MVVSECEHNELFLEFGSSTQMEKVHVSLAKCPQISQTRLLLEINSQKGAVLKLFPGGSVFEGDSPVGLASWTRGSAWGTRQWGWRVAVHVAGPATRTDEMLFTEKKNFNFKRV